MAEQRRKLPRHVAIIMDGNGRWAKQRGLKTLEGHKAGAESVRRVIESARDFGLEYLTLYAFSTENWKRPREEVQGLMNLLADFIDEHLDEIDGNGVCIRAIGQIEKIPRRSLSKLRMAMTRTANNRGGTVLLALNYGARAEIAAAAAAIAAAAVKGEINPRKVDENCVAAHLQTAGVPDPDLLIRTSGELRLSNFLLWQLAYSEIYIADCLWPDFDKAEFSQAVEAYQNRERRYGGRKKE